MRKEVNILRFGGSMPLFLFIFSYFITYIHSFIHIHTIHLSVAIHCMGPLSISLSRVSSVGKTSLWWQARMELGPVNIGLIIFTQQSKKNFHRY
jgi:hypothetical protein